MMEKLTEHQFHSVWTTAAYMKGYDKKFFRELLEKMIDEKLIINNPKQSKIKTKI